MGRPCGTNVEKRNKYKLSMGKREGVETLGRPRVGGWIRLR